MAFGYDDKGNRTGLTVDSSGHTSYVYDDADRLTTLTDEASNNFTFGYDDADRLTSRALPNGITTTLQYDGMSRLKRLTHATGSTLYDDQFTYNSANQISQIAGLSATRNFTYDNIDRLTGMSDGTNTESYAYDAVGNRTASHLSSSYAYDSFNRIKSTDTSTYTHNANGSRSGKTGATWTYGWDRENRLISAGTGLAAVGYAYDALGRRVKRSQISFSTNIQKYTYDGLDVILDDINGTITKYQNGPGIDDKLKTKTGSTSQYYLQDHLGSTVALTNSSGAVTESESYDSFGNRTNTTFSNRYQFTGREYDATTGLQYSRARWYDPQLGRFISEDPIGFAGGDVNMYGYTANNPTNLTDPSGNIPPGLAYRYYAEGYFSGRFGTGADVADAVDGVIDRIKRALGIDPPVGVVPFPLTPKPYQVIRASDALKGTVDPLRVGRGLGCAVYADGLQDYERFDLIAGDVARGGTIALIIAGPIGEGLLGGSAAKNPLRIPNPAEEWVGPGSKVITNPSGDKVVLSADGTRRIRFDINRPYPHNNPHTHVEELINGRWRKSGPIYPVNVPHN